MQTVAWGASSGPFFFPLSFVLEVLQQPPILVGRSSLPTDVLQAGFLGSWCVFLRSGLATCRFTSRLANPLSSRQRWRDNRSRRDDRQKVTAAGSTIIPQIPTNSALLFGNVYNVIVCCALGTGKLKRRGSEEQQQSFGSLDVRSMLTASRL